MCSACHSASADSRVAIVSRRGADGLAMGRERLENGGRTSGANASRRATLLRILACALAGAGGAGTPAAAQTDDAASLQSSARAGSRRRRRGERAGQGSDLPLPRPVRLPLLRACARAVRGADVEGAAVARPRDLPPGRDRPAAAARRLRRQRDDAPRARRALPRVAHADGRRRRRRRQDRRRSRRRAADRGLLCGVPRERDRCRSRSCAAG